MPSVDPKSIRLTETVKKGGCAAKLPAGQLREILKKLDIKKPAALTVGTEHMDDACLWNLDSDQGTKSMLVPNGQSLVQTLDFFTPIVDDAYDFGAIAAANALSDVYAMGGSPKIALSILAFPSLALPIELLEPLLQGALDKIHEAGACLGGGHTIDDDTLKFGLSVTGFVPTNRAWTNARAQVGDVLILTKALGTGTLTSALKSQLLDADELESVLHSMKQLNRAPELLTNIDVHAATDITGFGLLGHGLQMARASNVAFRIHAADLPLLLGARASLEKNITNRAHRTNWEYVQSEVRCKILTDVTRGILTDPQTSGGLLLAIPRTQAEKAIAQLAERFPLSKIIGHVDSWTNEADGRLVID